MSKWLLPTNAATLYTGNTYHCLKRINKALTIWLSKLQEYYRAGIYWTTTMIHKDTNYSLNRKVSKKFPLYSSWREWQLVVPAMHSTVGKRLRWTAENRAGEAEGGASSWCPGGQEKRVNYTVYSLDMGFPSQPFFPQSGWGTNSVTYP